MTENTGKDSQERLVPLHDGGVVAPAAGLLTLFARVDDLQPKEFTSGLMRQLLQTVAGSLLHDRSLDRLRDPGWDEDADFKKHYAVPSQLLADLLSRWTRQGWLAERERSDKKRDRKVYQLTPLGTAALMTLVHRCSDGVVHHMLDRMLLSIFIARSFPLPTLTERVPGLHRYLDGRERITEADWDWKRLRDDYRDALRREARELKEEIDSLELGIRQLRRARETILSREDLHADVSKIEARQDSGQDCLLYDGVPLPIPPLPLYVPRLLAFRNQRDRRPSVDMGLQPLLNFYRHFDHEFIQRQLLHGLPEMRSHLYAVQLRHVRHCADLLTALS